MLDFTKPVQTRDGKPVRILCTDADIGLYPVIGLIKDGDREDIVTWTLEGQINRRVPHANGDLIQVEEKPTPRRYAELIKRWAEDDKMRIKLKNPAVGWWQETSSPMWIPEWEYEEILPGDPLF